MRKILLGLPLVVLASTNIYAEEVLYCNEIKATGIFLKPGGVVTSGVTPARFKASINGNSFKVKGYSSAADGTYACTTPFGLQTNMLSCDLEFHSITYNTKNNYGSLAKQFIGDVAPISGGDNLGVSLFKCDTF